MEPAHHPCGTELPDGQAPSLKATADLPQLGHAVVLSHGGATYEVATRNLDKGTVCGRLIGGRGVPRRTFPVGRLLRQGERLWRALAHVSVAAPAAPCAGDGR